MDERVWTLTREFPEIFERRVPNLDGLDDDFVIIDVTRTENFDVDEIDRPYGELEVETGDDPNVHVEDELINYGLERWGTAEDENRSTPPPDLIDIEDQTLLEELINRPRSDIADRLRKRIKGQFPGGPCGTRILKLASYLPPPDALAFYLPFHRFPEHWGIYVIDSGVSELAHDLERILHARGYRGLLPHEIYKAALAYLFHHEAYHSAVEGFAIRSELAMRRPAYRTGFRKLLVRGWLPGAPHEETLATAYGLRKVRDQVKLPKTKLDAVVDALAWYLRHCPPAYADGVDYVDNQKFAELERRFKEEAITNCYRSRRTLDPEAWDLATYMLMPLVPRNKKYSWLCDRAAFKLSRLAVHYSRRRDVIRCLERLAQAHLEAGGRHVHIVREISENGVSRSARTQVPSGEVPNGTLNQMLKDLQMKLNVHQFRDKCRDVGCALS